MTRAKDLIIDEYYIPPGHSIPYQLIHKSYFEDQDEYSSPTSSGSKDIFLIFKFKHPDSGKKITKSFHS